MKVKARLSRGKGGARRGAALLSAMIVVTIVAGIAARALWQQWRSIEIEQAERTRLQGHWLLIGALDWARLILREDGRTSSTDHLAEPWAVPLREARLSDFLAANQPDADTSDLAQDSYLSGQIVDLQSRLNVRNLVEGQQLSPASKLAFKRLFTILGLPQSELDLLTGQLLAASGTSAVSPGSNNSAADAPLLPSRAEQLGLLGIQKTTVERLLPYITLLPEPTPVNINTADAIVLQACVPGLSSEQAQKILAQRSQAPLRSLSDLSQILGSSAAPLLPAQHSVSTHYFEVRARIRMGQISIIERSTVWRDSDKVSTLWTQRGLSTMVTSSNQP